MWAAAQDKGFAWHSSRIDGSNNDLVLGAASADLGLVAVRPAGGIGVRGTEREGFIVLSTRVGDRSAVEAMLLGDAGQLTAGPVALGEYGEQVLWIDAARTLQGTLAFWAVEDRGRATILVSLLRPDGRVPKEPRVVAQGALAWQVAVLADGAMLGVVVAGKESTGTGSVRLHLLDGSGEEPGKPITVSGAPTAQTDFDMARLGQNVLLAWSDQREPDARVLVAAVDSSGKTVRAPAPTSPPRGEEALIRLVPPWQTSGPAYLVWENLAEETGRSRRLLLRSVDASGEVGPDIGKLDVDSDDETIAEFAATPRGVAALTQGPECARRGTCDRTQLVPVFVELGAHFEPLAAEPMRLDALGGKTAGLAWGLTCGDETCLALATKATAPTPAYAVRLESRSSLWQSPAGPRTPGPAPRMATLRTVYGAQELADVAGIAAPGGALVATVSYFDPNLRPERLKKPAPDGRYEPLAALLQTRLITADSPFPEPKTISLRARSLGGVDLSPGNPPESLLVWAALDQGEPEVFLTLLDASGARVRQRMLTHTRGEVWDVASARVEGGWIVGWISEREGDPEVYATKVDRMLKRSSPEQRITRASGAATGLRLLASKDSVLAVWSDSRGGEPAADIFAGRINVADASPLGSEIRLSKTSHHSHSPALAPARDGVVIAWLESPMTPDSEPGAGVGVRVVDLGLDGNASAGLLIESDALQPHGGLTIACGDTDCHGVFAARSATGDELCGFSVKPRTTGVARATRLAGLRGSSDTTAAAFVGDVLFFTDVVDRRGKLEQMGIDWE
ncbi:MAG: hypothetical protein JW940_12190 [Polyangiaceae bacterium]|nr:hypothetical protein [Polyangiaceae bacterium]